MAQGLPRSKHHMGFLRNHTMNIQQLLKEAYRRIERGFSVHNICSIQQFSEMKAFHV